MKTADVIIVGSGASGLFNALFLPQDYKVIVITKMKKVIHFWRREESQR
jgi:aspartate oxidase